MEKSIETIWKEGFLKSEILLAPKLTDLYNKKSNHFIDKYKRMFKLNINLIVLGAAVLALISFPIGIPYLGVPLFLILNVMAFVDKKLLKELELIDKSKSSYDYLKSFDLWMKRKTRINIQMARVFYPYAFISFVLGFWFLKIKGSSLGIIIRDQLLIEFPKMQLLYGIPLIGIVAVLLIAIFLVFLGERLYKWDLSMAYGPVLRKLDELITDMETLRS